MELQDVIKQNEHKFTYKTTKRWGDLEDVANELDRVNEQLFNVYDDQQDKAYNKDLCSKDNSQYDQYDFENDLQHFKISKCINVSFNKPYQIVKQPHILDNIDVYKIRRQLNKEQARIVNDVISKKKCYPNKAIQLFLTGGAGTGKTFTAKAIFQSLIRFYNIEMDYNPLQLKGS